MCGAKSCGWVGCEWAGHGSCVVGSGSCLFEDKKKIYISYLSGRSKFAIIIARSGINFPELLL